jgi:3-hydroxyacyl-[acyl-carrier-protein] dehydratase
MSTVRWTVPVDHPAFAGHFPGRPIVPGVVLLDRMIAAVTNALGRPVVGIGNAKFLSPVGPGAVLELSWQAGAGRSVRFDIACGGVAVATGALNLAE